MQYLFRFFLVLSAVVIIQYNRLEAQDARPLSIGETLEINSDILGEKEHLIFIFLPDMIILKMFLIQLSICSMEV